MQAPLIVLTGASGSGKTAIATRFAEVHGNECEVLFFDSIGVPSVEEMIAQYGDQHQPGGAWQRAITFHWIERAAAMVNGDRPVLLEGQVRIAFILEATAVYGVEVRIVLADCDDAIRADRLHGERNQPELVNEQMMGWARYLREEAKEAGCAILDTGAKPIEESVAYLYNLLQRN